MPTEYVDFGGGWVMLQHGLLALGPLRKFRPKSAVACVLPRATQHELQSNLKMASTCAGLGGAQVRPSCGPRLATASARPEAT